MHEAAYTAMKSMLDEHLAHRRQDHLVILEVGSLQSGYEHLILPPWQHVGLDIAPGTGVDLVVGDGDRWDELQDETFDAVISGSCLEHTEHPWTVVREIARVLKPGGLAFLIAPSTGPVHRHPIDCWRILEDGMRMLARWAGLSVVKIGNSGDAMWADTTMVAMKVKGLVGP